MFGAILGTVGKLLGGDIFKSVFGVVTDYFEHKRVMAQARQETELKLELSKQQMIEKKETADIDWDQIMAKNSASSWKDEYWTIVLSIPTILIFVPGMAHYIMDGFDSMRAVPEWYKYALMTAIAAAFGRSEIIKWKDKLSK